MKDNTFTFRLPTETKTLIEVMAIKQNKSQAELVLQYTQQGLTSDIQKLNIPKTN